MLLVYKESKFVSCLPSFSEEIEKVGLDRASQISDVSSFIKTAHRITTIPQATMYIYLYFEYLIKPVSDNYFLDVIFLQ